MGKHNAPSKHPVGPIIAKAGTLALAATGPILLTGGVAEAATTAPASVSSTSILEAIAKCESGGKNIPTSIVDGNGKRSSTAGGFFQIVNGTWRAHGGLKYAPTALQATYSQQFQVALNILNGGQGLSAWNESRSCWSKKISSTPAAAPVVVSAPKVVKKSVPPPVKVTAHKAAQSYVIKKGDTLGKIARTHGTTVSRLASLNRGTVHNVNRIFTGNRLRLV